MTNPRKFELYLNNKGEQLFAHAYIIFANKNILSASFPSDCGKTAM